MEQRSQQQSPQLPSQQLPQQPTQPVLNEQPQEISGFSEPLVPDNNCTVTSNVNSNRPRIEGLPIDDEDCDGDIGNRINPNALKSLIG